MKFKHITGSLIQTTVLAIIAFWLQLSIVHLHIAICDTKQSLEPLLKPGKCFQTLNFNIMVPTVY